MTTFSTMLDWFAPDTNTKLLDCYECGTPVEVGKRVTRVLCEDCRAEARRSCANRQNRNSGVVRYTFDDPHVNLVYAVIRQAIHDKAWQWHASNGQYCRSEKSELALEECDPADFLEDGGADLWLEALGLDLRPSQRAAIREMEPNE